VVKPVTSASHGEHRPIAEHISVLTQALDDLSLTTFGLFFTCPNIVVPYLGNQMQIVYSQEFAQFISLRLLYHQDVLKRDRHFLEAIS
jgi:hypothetical protein